jgi:hypothetical protein
VYTQTHHPAQIKARVFTYLWLPPFLRKLMMEFHIPYWLYSVTPNSHYCPHGVCKPPLVFTDYESYFCSPVWAMWELFWVLQRTQNRCKTRSLSSKNDYSMGETEWRHMKLENNWILDMWYPLDVIEIPRKTRSLWTIIA